ncbi:hypothetical protein L6452_06377 [Arctium lappa]|uniref:Uncharacterized protein n=1 Tax=Arctium lappa TaxID=4217 RepID=A0ACB9EJ20_ARCLA|nr:hypothetical protein L6452_06377 [Arctium lappa]
MMGKETPVMKIAEPVMGRRSPVGYDENIHAIIEKELNSQAIVTFVRAYETTYQQITRNKNIPHQWKQDQRRRKLAYAVENRLHEKESNRNSKPSKYHADRGRHKNTNQEAEVTM